MKKLLLPLLVVSTLIASAQDSTRVEQLQIIIPESSVTMKLRTDEDQGDETGWKPGHW